MSQDNHFINEADEAVSDFIDGIILTYPNLQKVGNQNVIIRRNIPPNKVTLLSGGGSGHEPSHAGWIGDGMLDGAVLGGCFASPSVKQILAAIRAVTPVGAPGCLLIVKNYTGDRLNFGMACEMANGEGRKCRMVVVADDCAIPRHKGSTGARGVCGTILVHKVAGAAAEKGMSLEEIVDLANFTASRIGSLGVSIGGVCIPGMKSGRESVDAEKIMELGIGIHGEAGIQKSEMLTAKKVTSKIVDTIVNFGYGEDGGLKLKSGDKVVLLLNNLGATSNFEMGILSKEFIENVESNLGCHIIKFYQGPFMTSFNMHGISMSILCLDSENKILSLLDHPSNAPAWIMSETLDKPRNSALVPLDEVVASENPSEELASSEGLVDGNLVEKAIKAACNAIIEAESKLTEWDLIVGDGDCGMTMKRGATKILSNLDENLISTANPISLCLAIADAVSQSMGGTSGILFELFFRKMASTFGEQGKTIDFGSSFKAGVEAVEFYGGAKAGYRTMLDALIPASECIGSGIAAVAEAASCGAESTKNMIALAGRSNYLSEDQLAGTPDPGAKAVAIILTAIAEAI